ncbi:hypothetical protein [Flagellimonas eckloniae]|uniref:Uncharacterized protein n=1 Tax=Flagellimonas eckloniae TaxID=346185 RepID=A0A0Q1DPN3_9FLAO|nr:hypothetical protein [Allomuricauda eckloniae]KQC30946.1 hypothetical protein AAY42_14385 [Allomuricauda eckloniae]
MELKLNIGIEDLKFGMFQKMVYGTIGIPDKIQEDEEDSDNVYLEYNNQKLRLTIYKNEDNRLGYIYCASPQLSFNGFKIIDQDADSIKNEVFGDLVKKWEIEEYDFWSTHSDDDNWLTLNVEFGKVSSVEIGAPWKNEEEYDWPNDLTIS